LGRPPSPAPAPAGRCDRPGGRRRPPGATGQPPAQPREGDLMITLVRHGETDWSRSGRHTGRTDVPLTDAGRRQAGQAGAKLAHQQFELVLTSPLSRAVETCQLSGMGDGEPCADLLEWDYGEYEGG